MGYNLFGPDPHCGFLRLWNCGESEPTDAGSSYGVKPVFGGFKYMIHGDQTASNRKVCVKSFQIEPLRYR